MRLSKREQVLCVLPGKLKGILLNSILNFDDLQEIRMREENPLMIRVNGREQIFSHIITKEELRETMEYVSNYSLYAYENELRQGFLTIEGGHRVGVSGKIITEKGKVKSFQYISSINIRICHEIKGCADQVFPAILEENQVVHTMIISPPGRGKTTLLRDIIRQVSDGNQYINGSNVGVVDERSEIGGCYLGVPQNNIGKRTDILDNCPKAEGMMMMIRSMNPQILAVDEIGTSQDVEAISYAMHSGVTMLATVHGHSLEEIRQKPGVKRLMESHTFKRFIVISKEGKAGKVSGIFDEKGTALCF